MEIISTVAIKHILGCGLDCVLCGTEKNKTR